MPAVPVNAPSSTTTSNGVDCEPDDAWKDQLRKRIEEGLQSMVEDAKENHATELSKAPDTPEARHRLEADYDQAMKTIKGLASEQYKLELDIERNQRRWTAGVPMTPGWTQYFRQEQQNIMNSIKQSNQTDNSVRTATESPTEERRSAIPKPSNEPPAFAPTTPVPLPVPPSPSPVRPAEEREKPFVSPQSVRRGSDVRSTMSGDHDPGSFRRSHHASVHERPALPDNWVTTETVEEPEEIIRSPPPQRARLSSFDKPPQPSPVSPDHRWDSSLGRSSGSIHEHLARSPPRGPPEVWKPAISPAEDALPPKHYNLGRRRSSTSMRSTGSGASIRPSIREPIPERADDDGTDESAVEENDYDRVQETTELGRTTRISMDKSRQKEKRPHVRTSRQSLVDPGLRSDDLGSSSMRSDDRHRPIDSPGKSPPYYEYREQSSPRDNYAHRDQQVPSLDPRPIPASRSSYGDERDYGPQYSTPHRPPHGPKSPPYHPQRESRPISRQVSFTRQPHADLDDDNDEREMDRGGGRERERHWEREYDRDSRDRDGGRDIHSDPRRSTTYPYSASRHPLYPNPSPVGSSRPAPPDYDVYEDWEGVPGSNHGRYNNYRSPPPLDNLEYQRRSDSTRPGPGLSRQSSYVRPPRDDPERRYAGDNDGYSRDSRHIPISRHTTPNLEEPPLSQPAWREWAAEGNRHPNYDYHQQARSPPPNTDPFLPPPRRFTHPPQLYHHHQSSLHDDRPPSFGGREKKDSSHRSSSIVPADEYDSANDDTDSEEGDGDEEDGGGGGDDDDDDDSSEDGAEAKRLRDLEAKKQKLQEHRREADDELMRMELEIKRSREEARKKKEEEDRRDEVRRKEEEARRKEEEAKKRDEDARKKEEDILRMEEEVKRKEEDAARKAAEAMKIEALAKKKEADAKKKEKDARIKEAAAKRKEEEARRKAEELSRKEEEAKQREAQLEQDTEKTKQMQLQTQKIAENLKKKEEEAHKKDMEMKEREDTLRRREELLMRREADTLRREQEAKKNERAKQEELLARQKEEGRKAEEAKEAARQEEIQKEEARKEEVKKEETRKKEEVKRKEEARKKEVARKEEVRMAKARQEEEVRKEEARMREEEARKRKEAQQEAEREEEAKKKAAELKREEDNMKRKLQEAKRREEDFKFEDFRREQEEKRLQNESQHFDDMLLDLDPALVGPKVMEEQLILLQQAGFRKKEEDIRRTREERKRNDSVSNDSAWSNPSYPSNSPGTSPGISKPPPQFNGQPIPERSAGPSTGGWGAGPPPAWGPSIKPTAAAASPTASRSSTSTSTGKSRTGSVSSGTYPTSSSPHTASFSEAERTRKQQEFAETQQEQFRRAQEKMEAERQLKSAGRPLSKDELQRVFDQHERLWARLNTLNELSWNDFPWPTARQPSNPDDMTLTQIGAYMQSPFYPDKDKSRTTKDRIKENIKRWHPDRFETKLLPKVVEDEREKVKLGAGNVARYLSDLLRKENESNNFNIFGD